MSKKFGEYGSLPNEKESYGEGYATGRTWNYAVKPAGPYVHKCYYETADADWKAICAQSQRNSEEWWKGFEKARKDEKWS